MKSDMKLRTTTPASAFKTLKRVGVTMIAALLVVASVPAITSQFASADEFDEKIAQLRNDMDRYQAEADKLNNQAASLQNALAQLANEKAALQAQINLNQTQYDQLVIEINDTEEKIKENQDVLGTILANLYIDSQTSPIELIASSDNIGEFIDKQEYRNSVRNQLSTTIATVKELKSELTVKKTDVEKVLNQQKTARANLVSKEQQQASLLNQTKNDEALYQQLIADSADEIAEAKATQAALRARINNSGGYTLVDAGSLSDYPWNSSNCAMWGYLSTGGADGNGGDGQGYGCRQCASYVAWRIAKETGIYYSWGNAKDFTQNAINNGYVKGAPSVGSIAVMDPAKAGQGFGHVAWVEGVSGNMITVSQYNYDYGQGYGLYSLMTLSADAFDHFVKIK